MPSKITAIEDHPQAHASNWRRPSVWLSIGLGAAMLLVAFVVEPPTFGALSQAVTDPQPALRRLMERVAWYAGWLAASAALGCVLAWALSVRGRGFGPPLFAAGLVLIVVSQLALIGWDSISAAITCTASGLVGVATAAVGRSRPMGRFTIPSLLAVLLGLPAIGGIGAWQLATATPPDATTPTSDAFTAEQKKRLLERLDAARQRGESIDRVELTLSDKEVSLLANWALQVAGMSDAVAQATLTEDQWSLRFFAPWRDDGLRLVAGSGDLTHRGGRLTLHLAQLRIGRLVVPRSLRTRLAGWLNEQLHRDPEIKPLADAIEQLTLNHGQMAVVYTPSKMPQDWLERFQDEPPGGHLYRLAQRYAQHLVEVAREVPRRHSGLEQLVRAAFTLARQHSEAGFDPVTENKAAIYTLSLFLADPRTRHLIGEVLAARRDQQVARIARRDARMAGRNDLAKHFFISAALTLSAGDDASNLLGTLKEEIDSAQGGSGFSFVDLLADRAGTRFAAFATSNAANARLVQRRLAQGPVEPQLLPEIAGLPEGLSEAQLQQQFGGIGGAGYRQVVDQIEARLDALELLARPGR